MERAYQGVTDLPSSVSKTQDADYCGDESRQSSEKARYCCKEGLYPHQGRACIPLDRGGLLLCGCASAADVIVMRPNSISTTRPCDRNGGPWCRASVSALGRRFCRP